MNLERAFVLLIASVNAVAGFAPGVSTPRLMAVNTAQLNTRVASSLLSETTDAAESAEPVAAAEDASAVAAADEEPSEPEYDVSIYVGNISFGKSVHVVHYCKSQTCSHVDFH